MLAILDGGCRVVGLRDGVPIRDGPLSIWKHFGTAFGAKAISLRVLELPAGSSATIRNETSDEVLYVLSGSGPGLSPDTGIYLPPATSLMISATETLTLISSQCPDDGATLEGYEPGHGSLLTVNMHDRPVQRTGDRWYREVINADDGSTQVTQFVGGIPPGRAPDHYHLYEEVIVILEGEGRMWAGSSNTPISHGSCIFLPHGQVHCVENRSDGEMRLLGVFYPAGSPAVRYGSGR
ncbi:MAG: cupin domain-containing protein [Thermoanaerobaculia bacterium]